MGEHNTTPCLALLSLVVAGCAEPLPDLATDDITDTMISELPTDSSDGSASADTSSGSAPICGNGIVEIGETCDAGGVSPICDIDCTEVVCGDLDVNTAAGEDCEGDDLAGSTCQDMGFDGGTLSCGVGCAYDAGGCGYLPGRPLLQIGFSQVKQFDFNWVGAAGAEYYQLLESAAPGELFVQIGDDIMDEGVSVMMPLHLRFEASYVVRACNHIGCTDSAPVSVTGSLAEAVGYFKASNTGANDWFGYSVALSGDGSTLAVAAYFESSGAAGVDGNQADESAPNAGAVYVFVRDRRSQWIQQAYIKASNAGPYDNFGVSVALSDDGDALAVGALEEDGGGTGVGGNQADESAPEAGAAYIFARDAMGQWSQQAYLKASNTGPGDHFGCSVALSGDGNTLAVGAAGEDGGADDIDGNQDDESAPDAGAVYVFVRDGVAQWSQQAYLKASNSGYIDWFGHSVTLSGDGNTLAVGAYGEDSNATGIDGDQTDDSAYDAGAVYVFVRDGMSSWAQQAYVKSSNADAFDQFGWSVALSEDGNTLAVGANFEDSDATGIGGDQNNDLAPGAGAVYVFMRDPMDQWSQQAYVKASNTGPDDWFGDSVALSDDGRLLAIGAHLEDGNDSGINGGQTNFATDTGAVYMLVRDATNQWSQYAYIKASNTNSFDHFGTGVALSGSGDTLAVGAILEDSNAIGISGNQADDSAPGAGAVYLY